MITQTLKLPSPPAIDQALSLLHQGEVIALPTDTVYGVAALALNGEAVARLYHVKDRPLNKPIPVFVPSIDALSQVCQDVPPGSIPWLRDYWPGGVTVILPASPALPGIVTNNGPTVAVRIPDHPLALALLARLRQPLAVTSANLSGGPNPQTAAEVLAQLEGRIPLILDDGPTPGPLPSTIVDLTQTPPRVLRQGAVQVDFSSPHTT